MWSVIYFLTCLINPIHLVLADLAVTSDLLATSDLTMTLDPD